MRTISAADLPSSWMSTGMPRPSSATVRAPVGVEDDPDVLAEAAQRLVHRVVHHLEDQVVQAVARGVPDVHGGALADRFQALEDLDVARGVVVPVPGLLRPRRLRHAAPPTISRVQRVHLPMPHLPRRGRRAGGRHGVRGREDAPAPGPPATRARARGRRRSRSESRSSSSSTGGDPARRRTAAASASRSDERQQPLLAARGVGPGVRAPDPDRPGRRDAGRQRRRRAGAPRAARAASAASRRPRVAAASGPGGTAGAYASPSSAPSRRHRLPDVPAVPAQRLQGLEPPVHDLAAERRRPARPTGASSASASPRPASRPSSPFRWWSTRRYRWHASACAGAQLRAAPSRYARRTAGAPLSSARSAAVKRTTRAHGHGPPAVSTPPRAASVSRTSRRWTPCSTSPGHGRGRRVPRDALGQPGRAERASGQQQVDGFEEGGLALAVGADRTLRPGSGSKLREAKLRKADSCSHRTCTPRRASLSESASAL